MIRDLCLEFDVLAITDEIYEHILYEGTEHISMVSLAGMRDRTVTINGMSKTYSVTGWRVGWAVAPEKITDAIRKVHDFLTVGAPAPLQEAGAAALSLPPAYYAKLAEGYRVRRDHLMPSLTAAGFKCFRPRGAYYVMTDISAFGFKDDLSFAKYLVQEIGVACVPGSSFYRDPRDGARQVRFAFCKKPETLDEAAHRLAKLANTNLRLLKPQLGGQFVVIATRSSSPQRCGVYCEEVPEILLQPGKSALMALNAVEQVATQVPADDFQALEEKVYRTIEMYKAARQAQAAAERDAQRLRQQMEDRDAELAVRRETVQLKKEREEIRGRVEKMLQQIESLAEAS